MIIPSKRNLVRVEISTQLLLDVLNFPPGTEVKVCFGEKAWLGTIDLVVYNDRLPVVNHGDIIPKVTPIITREPKSDTVVFDWNLKNKNNE